LDLGKNEIGDAPIHMPCRDKHVSIQAIKLLAEVDQVNVSETATAATTATTGIVAPPQYCEQEATGADMFPLRLAVMSDANLDVTHFPDALTTWVRRPAAMNDDHEANHRRDLSGGANVTSKRQRLF
jgi:hypothetical protein